MSDSTSLVTFDGTARLIIVEFGVTQLDAKIDLYSTWKRWVLNGNANWSAAFRTVGGDPVSATLSVAPYFFLINGWKIRPFEGTHQLSVIGNLYVEGGAESPFVPTLGNFNVLVSTQLSTNALQISVGIGTAQDVKAVVWGSNPSEYSNQDDTFGQEVTNISSKTKLIPGLF